MMEQETVKPLTAEEYLVAYNTGYQAGLAKAQRDDDDAFWLRQYSGYAIHGILSAETMGYTTSKTNITLNVECAVDYAKALLEEVKKHEKETEQ